MRKKKRAHSSEKGMQDIIKRLLNLPVKEKKHELAEIEIKFGKEARFRVESELKLIEAEDGYKQDAEYYYDQDENINTFPKDFQTFPVIKQRIFRKVNSKRKKEIKGRQKTLKKNQRIIQKVLLYRIENEKSPYLFLL